MDIFLTINQWLQEDADSRVTSGQREVAGVWRAAFRRSSRKERYFPAFPGPQPPSFLGRFRVHPPGLPSPSHIQPQHLLNTDPFLVGAFMLGSHKNWGAVFQIKLPFARQFLSSWFYFRCMQFNFLLHHHPNPDINNFTACQTVFYQKSVAGSGWYRLERRQWREAPTGDGGPTRRGSCKLASLHLFTPPAAL